MRVTRVRYWMAGLMLVATTMVAVSAADAGGRGDPPTRSMRALIQRIEQLEASNRALSRQNREIEQRLRQQTSELEALKQQLRASAAPVQQLQQEVPRVKQQVAALEAKERESFLRMPFSVGFRTGWAESPYDMPGGYFYGGFIRAPLLTQEDGVPYGTVAGELMAGAILGHGAVTSANLASQLGLAGPVMTWLTTVEIQPTVQYHLDLASVGLRRLRALRPYVLVGPSMWVTLLSTPVVNKGNIPGNRFRHSDANFQPGGVYGLGFRLRLGELISVPAIDGILAKTSVGAEWRYNEMVNGEQFQQYTASLALEW